MRSLMRWDPFRIVKRWDPFDELRSMQREMDRLFERFLGSQTSEYITEWLPAIESYIKDGRLVFKAELPGVDPKDPDVSVTEREVVIRGERKHEKDAKEEDYTYREISYGSFERRFMLPEGAKIDELKANFAKGLLEITVPVPEKAEKARKIEIETTDTRQIEGEKAVKKAA